MGCMDGVEARAESDEPLLLADETAFSRACGMPSPRSHASQYRDLSFVGGYHCNKAVSHSRHTFEPLPNT